MKAIFQIAKKTVMLFSLTDCLVIGLSQLTNAVILAAQSNRVVEKKLNELFSGGPGRIGELLKMSSKKRTEDQVTTAVLVLQMSKSSAEDLNYSSIISCRWCVFALARFSLIKK